MIVTTTHSYEINYKFAWKCTTPRCGNVIQRQSRSVDVTRQCCGKCRGRLIEIEIPGSKNDAEASTLGYTPKKKRAASAFSLFVQKHSNHVPQALEMERAGKCVAQTEVMKECGRLWKLEKANDEAGGDGSQLDGIVEDLGKISINEA